MSEEIKHTHKVTLTAYSDGPEESVNITVKWDPDLEGVDIEALGYLPASFEFLQKFILPAIDAAFQEYVEDPMMAIESPSNRSH
jgi:hypothetical protein